MLLKELSEKLAQKAPKEKYCYFNDKVGLFVGDTDRDIKKAVTATEASLDVIEYAAEIKADLILCHHPFIFNPVERVTTEDLFQKKLYKLISNNIAVYSMHTNLDAAPGGLCDICCELMGLKNTVPILTNSVEENGEIKVYPCIGRVGELENEMTCEEFRLMCYDAFQIPYAKCNFNFDQKNKKIKKVGVNSGAGMFIFDDACKFGIDAYICGDIKHDQYLYATERDVFVLDIGHYETECTSSVVLGNYIRETDPSVEVINFELIRGNKLVKKMLGV